MLSGMKLENKTLVCTQKEFDLIKRYNWIPSPYNAGLYLYHALKREDITMEWNVIFFRDIYMAFRKKDYRIEG